LRRVAESSDEVACLVLRGWAGSRLEGRDGLVCRGEKNSGEHRPPARGNSGWCERTRKGSKASKRVKLVEGSDPAASGPG
jgi:hypothetical protein